MNSSNPNYLPKAPFPNIITSRIRAYTYEFGVVSTDLQSLQG